MVETVIKIMKAFNYFPRVVLRDVEPTVFNCLNKPITDGGGNLGHSQALIEEENEREYQRFPRYIDTHSELTVDKGGYWYLGNEFGGNTKGNIECLSRLWPP